MSHTYLPSYNVDIENFCGITPSDKMELSFNLYLQPECRFDQVMSWVDNVY